MSAMPLQMEVDRPSETIAVVHLAGSLSLGSTLSLADARVRQLIEEGVTKMVMDVAGITHADSSGLGFLMHTNGVLASKGGSMRVAGINDRLRSLVTLTRVDQLLHLDNTPEESLQALKPL